MVKEMLTKDERDVLEVLREHPRSVQTIAWGVLTYTGDALLEPDVLIALKGLEEKRLAAISPVGMVNEFWVKRDRKGGGEMARMKTVRRFKIWRIEVMVGVLPRKLESGTSRFGIKFWERGFVSSIGIIAFDVELDFRPERKQVDLWLLSHDIQVRHPRLYKFWDWVIQPGGLGLRRWLKYCLRK